MFIDIILSLWHTEYQPINIRSLSNTLCFVLYGAVSWKCDFLIVRQSVSWVFMVSLEVCEYKMCTCRYCVLQMDKLYSDIILRRTCIIEEQKLTNKLFTETMWFISMKMVDCDNERLLQIYTDRRAGWLTHLWQARCRSHTILGLSAHKTFVRTHWWKIFTTRKQAPACWIACRDQHQTIDFSIVVRSQIQIVTANTRSMKRTASICWPIDIHNASFRESMKYINDSFSQEDIKIGLLGLTC